VLQPTGGSDKQRILSVIAGRRRARRRGGAAPELERRARLDRPDDAAFQAGRRVAQFAELLRHSYWAKGEAVEDVIALAREAQRGIERDPDLDEFVTLLEKAARLAPERR
jgi:hypothetical protein